MRRTTFKSKKSFTLVELMIAVGIVILLLALSINGIIRSRISANEAAAIKTLKTLHAAFSSYRFANSVYPYDLVELGGEYSDPPYIDRVLAEGTRQGYNFAVTHWGFFARVGDGEETFVITAEPVHWVFTGHREFYVTESGEVIAGDAELDFGIGGL